MSTAKACSGAACIETLVAHGLIQGPDQVDRIDLIRDRKVVAKTRSTTAGPRWFLVVEGEPPQRLEPTADNRIPLSAWLSEQWAEPSVSTVRLVAWRPGRRLVLDDGTGFVKGFRRSREAVHASRLEALCRTVENQGAGGFRLARPVRTDERHSAIMFEKLSGTHPEISAANVACFNAVGSALTQLQRSRVAADLEVFSRQDEFDVLRRFRRRMGQLDLDLPRGWEETFLRVGALIDQIGTGRQPVPTHRDLHDGQILWDGRRPGLLDYDLLCLADAALDPANLCAHLALRSLQRVRDSPRPSVLDRTDELACRDAFLASWRGKGAGWRRRFDWFETTSLLRLALVYAMRPRQASLSIPLTELARNAFERVVSA